MKLKERFDRRSLQELGRWLKEKQARLRESAQRVMSTGLASRSADSVEWAAETLHEEMQVAFLNTVNLQLVQIEAALEGLANGEYGLCYECGEFIGLERLRVLPFALRCAACQSRTELQVSQLAEVGRTAG
jgi:DnaK suppressor protein